MRDRHRNFGVNGFVPPTGCLLAAAVALSMPVLAAERFNGNIVKLDATLGKVTLTHGAIPTLDMPAGMTMAYRVGEKTMLNGLKVGDRVRFDARDDGGTYTITKFEKAH